MTSRGDHSLGRLVEAYTDTLDSIKLRRDSMRVLSLTRDARGPDSIGDTFDCCWSRPRMWEQYGDNHHGACLVFEHGALVKTLQAALGKDAYVGDVRYSPKGISSSSIWHIQIPILDAAQRANTINHYFDNHGQDLFFLKSDDFATEHEYRVVFPRPDPDYHYVDYEDSLVAVVVGERFPYWGLEGARAACESAGVGLRQMCWKRGKPLAPRVRSPGAKWDD